MYLSASEPTRSLRAVEWEGRNLVIVGGDNHKTGQGICTIGHYENLELFAGNLLGIKTIPYRWAAQDLITLDRVPYIGKISDNEEIYIATGFGKWGMTSGTLAAQIISDQIQRKDNPYTELYDPSRFKAGTSLKTSSCKMPMWQKSSWRAKWKSSIKRQLIWKLTKEPLCSMMANVWELIRIQKVNFIWWIEPVPIWAVNANGTTGIVLGIALAMVPASPTMARF